MACDGPIRTPASVGLSGAFFPWPSHGSHTAGPAACRTDPSQIQLDTGVSPCPLLGSFQGGTGLRSGGKKACLSPPPQAPVGERMFCSNFPTHTGTCTACARTQGASGTAALKQPGLASAQPSFSWGFRGNRAWGHALSSLRRCGTLVTTPGAFGFHPVCYQHGINTTPQSIPTHGRTRALLPIA